MTHHDRATGVRQRIALDLCSGSASTTLGALAHGMNCIAIDRYGDGVVCIASSCGVCNAVQWILTYINIQVLRQYYSSTHALSTEILRRFVEVRVGCCRC